MNKINAKIVNKIGEGVRGIVYFEAECGTRITPELAMEAQATLGYHPAGYAFEKFQVEDDLILLRYKATWQCQASCD